MSSNKNSFRFDLSDWLVHFVKKIDLTSSSPPPLPYEWPQGAIVEDSTLSPFFILRQIIRDGRLLPTWSIRKGNRTIYGNRPAICFTEMPLAAFLMAGKQRSARNEQMSSYGVMIPKDQLFKQGARPVIYGLAENSNYLTTNSPTGARLLDERALPLQEQYRYAAFNPTKEGTLDWSHEREWRWPTPDEHPQANTYAELSIHGLDIRDFTGIGFIVKNERQANLLTYDILRLIDANLITENTVNFILIQERFPDINSLINPNQTAKAIADSRIEIASYFEHNEPKTDQLIKKFDALVEKVASTINVDEIRPGELGKCWLWLHDNTSPLARALISQPTVRGIEISEKGHYLVEIAEFRDDTGLRLRQNLTIKLAQLVQQEFETSVECYSALGSDDPNDAPSYTDWIPEAGGYLNYAHEKEDY